MMYFIRNIVCPLHSRAVVLDHVQRLNRQEATVQGAAKNDAFPNFIAHYLIYSRQAYYPGAY